MYIKFEVRLQDSRTVIMELLGPALYVYKKIYHKIRDPNVYGIRYYSDYTTIDLRSRIIVNSMYKADYIVPGQSPISERSIFNSDAGAFKYFIKKPIFKGLNKSLTIYRLDTYPTLVIFRATFK